MADSGTGVTQAHQNSGQSNGGQAHEGQAHEGTVDESQFGWDDGVEELVETGAEHTRSVERTWRRVPSVNVLPSQRAPLPANFAVRGILVLGFALLSVMAFTSYRDWQGIENQAVSVQSQLTSIQRQLSVRRSEIEPLETEINLLTLKQEEAQLIYDSATAANTDWNTALTKLFAINIEGVQFRSASVDPNGRLALTGVASSGDAIAALPGQLSLVSGLLELQGIVWESAVSPPTFTAEFVVAK